MKHTFVIVTPKRIFGIVTSETGIFIDFNSLSSECLLSKTNNLNVDGRNFGTRKSRMFHVILNGFIVGENVVVPLKIVKISASKN